MKVLIYVNIIVATILGIFGQSSAYFINEHIVKISPVDNLIALTIISVLLFISTPILINYCGKKGFIKKEDVTFYMLSAGLVGIGMSSWSLFVLTFWWR